MQFHRNLKLGAIVAFLLIGLLVWSFGPVGKAQAQKVVIVPKDSAAKAETPVSVAPAKADTTAPDTTNILTKAMNDFHSVLYPMWHQAYPGKDFKAIREQAPIFKQKLMTLIVIPAPDDMEEAQREAFFTKRQELAFYVDQYAKAATDSSDSVLAADFEKMHWGYEELDKVFMVEIKQLDSFHETLYYLWHKALPAKDYKSVKQTVPVLKAEVDSIMLVKLPASCQDIKVDFEAKRTALKDAVYQLADVCQKGTNQQIDDALALMHERFMELSSVLR
jgi:hypothetical protein